MRLSHFLALACCLAAYVFPTNIWAQSETQMTSAALLEKAIGYHDPNNQWPKLRAVLNIRMETPGKSPRESVVQLNNAQGIFSLEASRDSHTTFYRISPQDCRLTYNGSEDFTAQQAQEHRLTCEQGRKMKNYYTYLYGLPMKLKDPGTQAATLAYKKEFRGKQYWVLEVSYDPEVGKDIWFFYFDTQTYALRHYQFYHDLEKGDGEYILLDQEATVQGIMMPKNRAWYTNLGDRYLGTDFLSVAQ
ncbi:MAG: DUF6503 family protein [Flavobacteriia bacterium]|nr:DUF6503 family protein [Flavobacteriia bacterium]